MPTLTSPSSPWSFSPAPESTKVHIAPAYSLYINGKFVEPRSNTRFPTINPATEERLADVAHASAHDVDAAVRAARAALPKWAALKPAERAKYLFRIARRIQERARELAVLETLDSGKPIRESRDFDVPLTAQHFFYNAGWADKLQYVFPLRRSDPPSRRRFPAPVGVCAQIIPWNFPLLMAAWKLAPALACGNTCILKPAETTPLTALRLAEIFDEVGLPRGVVNILTGDGQTGAALVNHPGIDKIAFTGSTEVGKGIAKAVAHTDKKLTLELGGKSANIIFEDASIDQAVEGVVAGIFFNQGHVCCAGSRLLVQESILDEVIQKLTFRMASIRVGDPLDKNTDLGAINSKAQLDKINAYLETGRREGASLCIPSLPAPPPLPAGEAPCKRNEHDGGGKPDRRISATHAHSPTNLLPRGYWCPPCFFTNVHPSHTIAREEIFGPVLAVMSFRTPDEAIARANNSPYGLAAGVWTDKGAKALDLARKLEAGVVWLNTYNKLDPAAPFGGFKESGFGREGGLHGLRSYLHV